MAIQIDGLSGSVSLIESIEMVLPKAGYVNVSNVERLRISIYTSTIIKVQLEWSHDGHRQGPISMYRCGSCMWKFDMVDVIMPYLRIHIINESGKPCDDLIVHTWSPNMKSEVEDLFKEVDKPKPKKPLERLFPSKQHQQVAVRDDRLPDFIPQGAILVGGEKGKITVIPKSNVGEYLMMGELGPAYKLPYPPTQLSETSKDVLNSQY